MLVHAATTKRIIEIEKSFIAFMLYISVLVSDNRPSPFLPLVSEC